MLESYQSPSLNVCAASIIPEQRLQIPDAASVSSGYAVYELNVFDDTEKLLQQIKCNQVLIVPACICKMGEDGGCNYTCSS